jgi:hypothetical protein
MKLLTYCDNLMYRVIHKSLRDFRPLQYSSQNGHAEGEHVNRGRDTRFCPALQVLDMSTLGDAADGMKLYMFQTVPLSIIRSFSLYTLQ